MTCRAYMMLSGSSEWPSRRTPWPISCAIVEHCDATGSCVTHSAIHISHPPPMRANARVVRVTWPPSRRAAAGRSVATWMRGVGAQAAATCGAYGVQNASASVTASGEIIG